MAGVAGTILGAYATMIGEHLLPYLLAASFMSAPGGILMAKIIMPDDPAAVGVEPEPVGEDEHGEERPANLIMAAAQGAQTGVKLAVAVGAISGAAFNPAVTLGAAVMAMFAWPTLWVYLVAQVLAGIAAGVTFVVMNPDDK